MDREKGVLFYVSGSAGTRSKCWTHEHYKDRSHEAEKSCIILPCIPPVQFSSRRSLRLQHPVQVGFRHQCGKFRFMAYAAPEYGIGFLTPLHNTARLDPPGVERALTLSLSLTYLRSNHFIACLPWVPGTTGPL